MIDHTKLDSSILAFDYGQKRIGVAHKPAGTMTIVTKQFVVNDDKLWQSISSLMDDLTPDEIVVGLPRNLDGEQTAQSQLAQDFADQLATRFDKIIKMQDETLSTEQADALLGKKITAKARRAQIDSLSAKIILEDYLL